MLRLSYFKKLYILLGVVAILFFVFSRNRPNNDIDGRSLRIEAIDKLVNSQSKSMACKQPNLPVNASEIMKYIHSVDPIDCSSAGPDWVKCEGSECRIQESVKNQVGQIECSFTDLIRANDYKSIKGGTVNTDTLYKLEKSDVVKVDCKGDEEKWSSTLTGVRIDPLVWERIGWEFVEDHGIQLNVLMFGLDSLSRNAFIRKLPKSYKYLTNTLQSVVLEGYNIVGDGTPQALIPILTGKTELELPDTRNRISNSQHVNVYPFIWNDFRKNGYATAFFEDVPNVGTFTYRLKGFDEQPTDHYMRPYYIEESKERKKSPKLCVGERPRHNVMLNNIESFFSVYKTKPKFLFGFHGELSHDDYNLVGVADDDIRAFFERLNKSGALNDTILIVMADHGHRFANIRNTLQGKQEERLPFFSFTFPYWFKDKYPDAYANFKTNQHRLATPFDIYSTLKSVIDFRQPNVADISKRSVSLFSQIPEERSCAHAYIEPHWCACLNWETISKNEPIVDRLSKSITEKLNEFTQEHREMCATLSVNEVKWVHKLAPNQGLLHFKKSNDKDGFAADLTDKDIKLNYDMYQINVVMAPGDSLFEASFTHYLDKDEIHLQMSDISRINMYGTQARCVENNLQHLRKYCYCTTDLF